MTQTLEKAVIKFPWNLTIHQLEGLTNYIARKLRCLINYDFLYSRKAGYEYSSVGFLKEESVSDMTGRISLSAPPFTFDRFKFISKAQDLSRISSIQLGIYPEFEPPDYKPEVVQLWDETRKAVSDYFEENDK